MAKKKMGRPSDYNHGKAEAICEAIATGVKGIHQLCKEREDFPNVATVFRWLAEYKDFRDLYASARAMQADLLAGEIIEISDDGKNDTITDHKGNPIEDKEWTNRSRLRVDSRKWLASKLAPKKYGDKLDIDHTTQGQPITGMKIT